MRAFHQSSRSLKDASSMSRRLLLGLLLLVAGLDVRAVEGVTVCPTHGCLLTPLDVMYDNTTKDALSVLRQTKPSSGDETIDDTTRKKALSVLKPAGDASKTTLTLRGFKGGRLQDQINQDRAMILSPFSILEDPSTDQPVAQLLGVFDGHGGGGERTSQYAIDHLPSLLATKLAAIFVGGDKGGKEGETDSAVAEALKEVFLEVDKNDPTKGNAGCTATVVLRLGQKLFVANAGDSVSFVGVYFGGKPISEKQQQRVQIVYQTREDKPDLPEEAARIRAAGGYVHIPPKGGSDVPRAYFIDESGRARYGLAMSRSLGDWKVKGVTAEPIVDVLDLKEIVQKALATYAKTCGDSSDEEGTTDEKDGYCDALDSADVHVFAASISDGLMDYLSPAQIGKVLAPAFFDVESGLHPHLVAEDVILHAANGWENEFRGQYRDDIAIASFVVPL